MAIAAEVHCHRYKLKNKARFALFMATILLISLTMLFTTRAYGFKEKSFIEITVMKGDNLWNIAREYVQSGDIREFIFDLKVINGLENSNIFEGDTLIIPVSD